MVVLWVEVVSYERFFSVCEVTLYGPGFRVQVNLVVNDEPVAAGRVLSQQRLERRLRRRPYTLHWFHRDLR